MTIHPASGYSTAALPGPLAGFRACASGAWRIVARHRHLEIARSFLGPLPVDSFLQALAEPQEKMGREGVDREPEPRDGRTPRGRGATLEVDCGDGSSLVLKALKRGGLPARLRGGYHGASRVLAEMTIHEEAGLRGIPTSRLAFGATGLRDSGAEVGVLATELIPRAIRLGDLLAAHPLPGLTEDPPGRRRKDLPLPTGSRAAIASRRQGLRAAGVAVAKAHDLGLDHADLNIGNVLIQKGEEGWSGFVIDIGLSTLGHSLEVPRRAANLVRLLRSVEKHLGRDPRRARDGAAFLHGYLSSLPAPRRRQRHDLLSAIRRGIPAILIHRLGWSLLGRR